MTRTQLHTTADLSREEVDHLIFQAEALRDKHTEDLKGKIVASLFFEPSTRTRLSFESAALRLGAQVITIADSKSSSLSKGETLEDTIRMVECYADAIVMRHSEAGAAERACKVTKKPFLNAGDGANQHPTQALLDIYTMQREIGGIDGKTIAFVGDLKYGRTVHSLIYLLRLFSPGKILLISPKSLKIPEKYTEILSKAGIKWEETEHLEQGLKEAKLLYMTRIQQERFANPLEYEQLKGSYVLTKKLVKQGQEGLSIMHPLPRIDEIATEVDNLPQAAYFRQVENGVYMRMALLKSVLGMV